MIKYIKIILEIQTMDRPETYKKDFIDKFHIPRWEELPAIDLYMDQVISFTYASLGEFFDSACISPLTKSMVNNYVKARIIDPPVNKKYSRLSMACLLYTSRCV